MPNRDASTYIHILSDLAKPGARIERLDFDKHGIKGRWTITWEIGEGRTSKEAYREVSPVTLRALERNGYVDKNWARPWPTYTITPSGLKQVTDRNLLL